MKAKTLLAIFVVLICISLKAQDKKPKHITLTISYIHREDSISEIIGRRGYQSWKAVCKNVPPSWKYGYKILSEKMLKGDTCNCVFKRFK